MRARLVHGLRLPDRLLGGGLRAGGVLADEVLAAQRLIGGVPAADRLAADGLFRQGGVGRGVGRVSTHRLTGHVLIRQGRVTHRLAQSLRDRRMLGTPGLRTHRLSDAVLRGPALGTPVLGGHRLTGACLLRRSRLRLAPGALGTRHEEQVVIVGGGDVRGGTLGGVEEGVRIRGGDARLLHHACVLRQSLARDLAGVGHA
ncbi:hypothetical protein GCM10009837_01850 [Streptomyces durmitorensis]